MLGARKGIAIAIVGINDKSAAIISLLKDILEEIDKSLTVACPSIDACATKLCIAVVSNACISAAEISAFFIASGLGKRTSLLAVSKIGMDIAASPGGSITSDGKLDVKSSDVSMFTLFCPSTKLEPLWLL